MTRHAILLAVAVIFLFSAGQGCAPKTRYAWGKYDYTLYSHYKNPQDQEAQLERLEEIVREAEAQDRVPPGLYAEYGYALYQKGSVREAVSYFEKEKAKWPESNVLMEKMIRNVRKQEEIRKSSTAMPAPTAEDAK